LAKGADDRGELNQHRFPLEAREHHRSSVERGEGEVLRNLICPHDLRGLPEWLNQVGGIVDVVLMGVEKPRVALLGVVPTWRIGLGYAIVELGERSMSEQPMSGPVDLLAGEAHSGDAALVHLARRELRHHLLHLLELSQKLI
jgi:hypothetical protein